MPLWTELRRDCRPVKCCSWPRRPRPDSICLRSSPTPRRTVSRFSSKDFEDYTMRPVSHHRRNQRGSTLVLVMLMLPLFMIPLIGLAIDATMLYIVQAKLSAAVDGAALGAGRLLGTNANTTEIAGEFLKV